MLTWPEQRPIINAVIKALDSWWDFALLKVTVKTVFTVLASLWGIGFVLDSPSRMSVCVSPSSVLSLKDPERLMARGRSSREVALPPSGWPSPYRSKESWVGILLERLMLVLPGGRLYWLMLVGLTAQSKTYTSTMLYFHVRFSHQSFMQALKTYL